MKKNQDRFPHIGLLGCCLTLAAFVLAGWPGLAGAQSLTPLEEQGKRLYFEGKDAAGKSLPAYVGQMSAKIQASSVPCGNCHGADGKGRPEGGIEPPDITWVNLTKPYGHEHRDRSHPAFTAAALKNALVSGIDPGGNKLDVAMPRFGLTGGDVDALIAYLKRLESDFGPGVTAHNLRIGTLLPVSGPAGEMGRVAHGILAAYFEDLNSRGGVYGRHITLVAAEAGKTPMETVAIARKMIEQGDLFAFVAVYAEGAEIALANLAREAKIPLIAPLSYFPRGRDSTNAYTFQLFPPLADQARALMDYAARDRPGKHRAAVVVDAIGGSGKLVKAITLKGEELGWEIVSASYDGKPGEAEILAENLRKQGVDAVFYFASPRELPYFAAAAARISWKPDILGPGFLAGRDIFAMQKENGFRLFLVSPTSPADRQPETLARLDQLGLMLGLTGRHMSAQVFAYAAADVFTEALRRAGRSLRREGLIAELEGLTGFETGFLRPIGYGPNRHVGTNGAYVVLLGANQTTPPQPVWVPLN